MSILLLVQFGDPIGKGAFWTYSTFPELYEGLCQLYERGLKLSLSASQSVGNITYELTDLLSYLDSLHAVIVMLRTPEEHWIEHGREWIKQGLANHLRLQASPNASIS